jgi:hypothetical protein
MLLAAPHLMNAVKYREGLDVPHQRVKSQTPSMPMEDKVQVVVRREWDSAHALVTYSSSSAHTHLAQSQR